MELKPFIKLQLRAAAAVRKEVDNAIRDFTAAIEDKDAARVERFRSALESRIDELEDFCLDHEDDERAILFEKQRMRLRRALALAHDALSSETPTTPARSRDRDLKRTPVSRGLTVSMLDAEPTSAAAPTPKADPSKKKRTLKPLYGWETRPDVAPARLRHDQSVQTASGEFRATNVPGVYAAAQPTPDPATDFIDIDFVLTDAEYELLVAMRRAHGQRKLKDDRLNKKAPASPYIDASRVEAAIFRPPNRAAQSAPIWHY